MLQRSDADGYRSYPFIASWSMVEAMACGAVVVASDQKCVREYITHGQNGFLCDFFDHEAKEMIDRYQSILRESAARQPREWETRPRRRR